MRTVESFLPAPLLNFIVRRLESVMEDMDEIKELLREIRDLQKAHFERYKEFTQAVLARQQASTEEAERGRSEQRRFREEMRQAVHDRQARVSMFLASRWAIMGITAAILVLALSGAVMTFVLSLAFK